MVQPPPAYEPHLLEAEAQRVWKARKLPPSGGIFGPPDGALVRQFIGSFTSQDASGLVVHRAVAADVDARYLALAGRRALGTLRRVAVGPDEPLPPVGSVLERMGVWTGGDGLAPWDSEDRTVGVQTMVGRLAHRGVLVSRDLPMRMCPVCVAPRSPERIIYQEEEGDTFLVRFDLPWNDQVVHALAWVDAPWRLLGTSALLVHPELPYIVARYRRREVDELIVTSRSSVERFRSWIPDATIEVVEEHPGRFFEGRTYGYPLRVEFPTGGTLEPPGGTVIAVPDVTDTGTGIVPLVPGHGSTDATIAEAKGIAGWPLISPKGQFDLTLMHKYAGLDLTTGNDFIVRDLNETGAIFARLRVRRGVPHCAVCGSPLLWMPGRAWCLEPGRLRPDQLDLYRRLLPTAPALGRIEVAPWPVSETARSDGPGSATLLECSRCERLEALEGPVSCPCGGKRYPIGRRLVPSAVGALAAWAREDPIPVTDSVHLYVGDRRRVPVVVHHLMAMSGLEGAVGDVRITLLPTVLEAELDGLLETYGADAVRAAFVRAAGGGGAIGTIRELCAQEHARLARLWSLTQDLLSLADAPTMTAFSQPIGNFLGDLEAEDRALLARWERTRVRALADYDHWAAGSVYRRVFRFLETDLLDYRELVRRRLAAHGIPATKRSALRTMTHVLGGAAIVLGPILPFLAEALHRRLTAGTVSMFEGTVAGADRTLLNDDLCAAWDRWHSLALAIRRFRRQNHLAPQVTLPMLALTLADDERGDRFRADREVLERLLDVGRVFVGSPREPWTGRQRRMRPIESEIQRVYPSEATQIIHLLQRIPVRKGPESVTGSEFSVVIQGQPRRIFPSMVESSDTLPARVVPVPWSLGELYVELPGGSRLPERIPPPLSSDAFWLVRRLEHRLRVAPAEPPAPGRVAILAVSEPLATELRGVADLLSRYLGLKELRVLANVDEVSPRGRLTGRTRTGARWWVDVPGLGARPPRTKHKRPRPRSPRIPLRPPGLKADETDYSSEEFVAHEEEVRALGEELDELLGIPLLGPSKVAQAWDRGLTSVDAYRQASFDVLEDLPGFGRSLAGALVVKFGGTLPPLPARASRPDIARPPDGHPSDSALPWIPSEPPWAVPPVEPPGPGVEPVGRKPSLPSSRVTARELAGPPPAAPSVAPPFPRAQPVRPTFPDERERTTEYAAPTEPPSRTERSVGAADQELSREPTPPSPEVGSHNLGEMVVSTPAPAPESPALADNLPAIEDKEVAAPDAASEPSALIAPPPTPTEGTPPSEHALPALAAEEGAALDASSEPPAPATAAPALGIPADTEPSDDRVPAVQEAEARDIAPRALERMASEPEVEAGAPPSGEAAAPSAEPSGPVEGTLPSPGAAIVPTVAETVPGMPTSTDHVSMDLPGPLAPAAPPTPPPPETTGSDRDETPSATAPEIPSPVTAPEASPSEPPNVEASASAAVPEAETAPSIPPEEWNPAIQEPEVAPPELVPAAPVAEGDAGVEAVRLSPPPEVVPPPAPPPSGVELEVGSSIIVSMQPFLEATAAGHRGICVVRESPERIMAQVGSRPVDVYWLTNLGRGKTLKPNDLPGLLAFLTKSLEEDRVMAFFVEGIEYLVRIHGPEALLGRIAEFDRLARERDARIWVHVTPDLLSSSDLERIVDAFGAKTASAEDRPTA